MTHETPAKRLSAQHLGLLYALLLAVVATVALWSGGAGPLPTLWFIAAFTVTSLALALAMKTWSGAMAYLTVMAVIVVDFAVVGSRLK